MLCVSQIAKIRSKISARPMEDSRAQIPGINRRRGIASQNVGSPFPGQGLNRFNRRPQEVSGSASAGIIGGSSSSHSSRPSGRPGVGQTELRRGFEKSEGLEQRQVSGHREMPFDELKTFGGKARPDVLAQRSGASGRSLNVKTMPPESCGADPRPPSLDAEAALRSIQMT